MSHRSCWLQPISIGLKNIKYILRTYGYVGEAYWALHTHFQALYYRLTGCGINPQDGVHYFGANLILGSSVPETGHNTPPLALNQLHNLTAISCLLNF